MGRKSAKSVKNGLIDMNFEVVLVIVLIIVAILLVCFLNKKFRSSEAFTNNILQTQPSVSGDKQLHFFYATWCGYSTNYLEDDTKGVRQLRDMISDNNLIGSLVEHDVDSDMGKDVASVAGVSKLPSFYKFENGIYTKFEGSINNQAMIDWLLA